MKLICLLEDAAMENAAEDYAAARRVEQYRIGKRAIFFPAGLKKQYLPMAAIERAERSERIIRAGKCVPVEERQPALLLFTAHKVVPMALEREESVDAVLAALEDFRAAQGRAITPHPQSRAS